MRKALIFVALTACASSKEHDTNARRLAHQTLQQAIVLKRELSAKIAAERLYYKDVERTLTAEERRELRQRELREAAIVALSVRNEVLAEPEDVSPEFLALKLEMSTEAALKKARAESAQRQARMKARLESLQELSDLQEELSRLERVLLELARKPTESDAHLAVEFIMKARGEYKRIEEEQDADHSENGE